MHVSVTISPLQIDDKSSLALRAALVPFVFYDAAFLRETAFRIDPTVQIFPKEHQIIEYNFSDSSCLIVRIN